MRAYFRTKINKSIGDNICIEKDKMKTKVFGNLTAFVLMLLTVLSLVPIFALISNNAFYEVE